MLLWQPALRRPRPVGGIAVAGAAARGAFAGLLPLPLSPILRSARTGFGGRTHNHGEGLLMARSEAAAAEAAAAAVADTAAPAS